MSALPPRGGPGFGDAEGRRGRLHEIHDVVSSLRQPVEAPDLTRAILERVGAERPFVDDRTRRLVWVSRLGFAASIAVAALGVAMLHRSAPGLLRLAPQPQPLSDVVATAGTEVTSGLHTIRATLASAAAGPVVRPVIDLAPAASERAPSALAPTPPSYSATYVALSERGRAAWTEPAIAGGPLAAPAVARVPLALTPAPRTIVDQAGVAQSGAWVARLSTSPLMRGTIIVVEPAHIHLPAAAPAPAPAARVRDRAVLDRLRLGAGGPDAAEPAVPR